MAKTSLTLIIAMLSAIASPAALASGGGYDEAPPTLDYYLSKLPAKSLGLIYNQTRVNPPPILTQPPESIGDIIQKFSNENPRSLLPLIDSWIAYDHQNYAGPDRSNFLQDMRDLAQDQEKPDVLFTQYLDWRWKNGKWFQKGDRSSWDKPAVSPEALAELDRQIAAAPPSLKPHWIYLKGALYFKAGDDVHSEQAFDRVLHEFPSSSRAEAALFMKARCKFSQGEIYDYNLKNRDEIEKKNKAESMTLFQSYLKKYPQGRFKADALGWMGGLDFKAGNYAEALPLFVEQTQATDHPEVFASAVVMSEKSLFQLSDEIKAGDFKVVAENPPLAMGLIYLLVNSSASETPPSTEGTVRMKHWRQEVLPKLAEAVTAARDRYTSKTWQPAYLLILAHAASEMGEHKKALELIDLAGESAEESDDLLLLRAIVQQRDGQTRTAIATLHDFLGRFPKSVLAPGARFRLATALQDNGQAGLALLELASLRGNALPFGQLSAQLPDLQSAEELNEEEAQKIRGLNSSALNLDYSGASDEQVDQLMDSLLNFAPPEQLELALKEKEIPDRVLRGIQDVLLERALAREDFISVQRLSPPERWTRQFHALAAQTKAVPSGSAPEQARKMAALGDLWAGARFTLLSHPLDDANTRYQLFRDDSDYGQVQRLENARALGLKSSEAQSELDRRDELQHAVDWWLKAADKDPGNPKAAEWILNAQTAFRKIAELSPYSFLRAEQTQMPRHSLELYQRLLKDYPGSERVKKTALYWSMPERKSDESDREYLERVQPRYENYDTERSSLLGLPDLGNQGHADNWNDILKTILALPLTSAAQTNKEFADSIQNLIQKAALRKHSRNELFMLNFLDDMALVAVRPDLSTEARNNYLLLRLKVLRTSCWSWDYLEQFSDKGVDDDALRKEIEGAEAFGNMKSIVDFLEFLDAAVVANHQVWRDVKDIDKDGQPLSYSTRDFPSLQSAMAEFLKKYPDSPKREAACLLEIRAATLATRAKLYVTGQAWPAYPRWKGGPVEQNIRLWPEAKPPTLEMFKAYYESFPKGEYRLSIESLESEIAVRNRDWNRALDLLQTLIANPDSPELREEARDRLVSVFDRLPEEKNRADLMAAINSRPLIKNYLAIYLKGNDSPLSFMQKYLQTELNLPAPPAAAE